MKTLMRRMGLFVILAASVQLMSCGGGGGGGGSSGTGGFISSGSWYVTGFEWPHDGNPWESDNFVIYSDGAGEDARQALALLAEETLSEIKVLFAIDNNDIFLFPPGQEKIDIYAYKNRYPTYPVIWGGWAYYGGLLIFSLDHPERTSFGHTEPEIYNPTLKHEIMHVVESLLKASNDPNLVDVWLTEGLAEAVSGGTAAGSITDLQKFNELLNQYGSRNPIAMHRYEYPNIEGIVYNYYYPMFQLAVEYLVDANGHGKTMNDVKDLLLDVRSGVPFPAAFQNRFGMSLSEYENQFFALMTAYLPS
jgi:hypothetical protein